MEIDPMHKKLMTKVSNRLAKYFGESSWHEPLPAVDELVCTYLSQNTNDINRDKAFQSIKQNYASWEDVRDADPLEFQECIRIAGLANQKGPNIQAALKRISEERGKIDLDWLKELSVQEAREWLTSLKGVGPKTAAIVMVFSLDMPAFPVDTHIYRVSGRIGLRPINLNVEKTHEYLESIADPKEFGPLHINLINLGRQICQARKPNCPNCPIQDLCQFEEKSVL